MLGRYSKSRYGYPYFQHNLDSPGDVATSRQLKPKRAGHQVRFKLPTDGKVKARNEVSAVTASPKPYKVCILYSVVCGL
jgi:hypothetical protein